MLVHDFDDEQTLAEEEAIAIAGGEDPQNELNNLQKVSTFSCIHDVFMSDALSSQCCHSCCVALLNHLLHSKNSCVNLKSFFQESDMPIEQLLALYGYDRGGGGGGNGEAAAVAPDGRLHDEELEEEMEEDEEEDDDDEESLESESSSSGNTKKEPTTEDPAAPPSEETALPVKASGEIKNRSDLHLLYSNEEGNVPETRLLRSSGTAGAVASDEEADEEDDVDYAPGEDEWRKVINDQRLSIFHHYDANYH